MPGLSDSDPNTFFDGFNVLFKTWVIFSDEPTVNEFVIQKSVFLVNDSAI